MHHFGMDDCVDGLQVVPIWVVSTSSQTLALYSLTLPDCLMELTITTHAEAVHSPVSLQLERHWGVAGGLDLHILSVQWCSKFWPSAQWW